MNASRFNPSPDSSGFDLYEHWEIDRTGAPYLISISSADDFTEVDSGDWIIRRRWAPAAQPKIIRRPD